MLPNQTGYDVTLKAKDPSDKIQRITYEIHGHSYNESIEIALELAGDKFEHLYSVASLRRSYSE